MIDNKAYSSLIVSHTVWNSSSNDVKPSAPIYKSFWRKLNARYFNLLQTRAKLSTTSAPHTHFTILRVLPHVLSVMMNIPINNQIKIEYSSVPRNEPQTISSSTAPVMRLTQFRSVFSFVSLI